MGSSASPCLLPTVLSSQLAPTTGCTKSFFHHYNLYSNVQGKDLSLLDICFSTHVNIKQTNKKKMLSYEHYDLQGVVLADQEIILSLNCFLSK